MKLKLSLFVILLLSWSSGMWAAIPSMEGLFRNVSNPDPGGDTVMVTLEVSELIATGGTEKKSKSPLFLKLVYQLASAGLRVLQVEYDDVAMNDSQIRTAKLITNFSEVMAADKKEGRRLFHSLLTMFVLNRSEDISSFFKKIQPEFKLNQEILNNEKVKLFNRYRQFLLASKKSGGNEDLGPGPMKSDDPSKQQEIDRVLKASMYGNTEQVKLERVGGRFYWNLDLNSIVASFTQNTQQMKSLMVTTPNNTFKVEVENYVLFDGIHELPANCTFEMGTENKLQIRFLKLSHFVNKGPDMNARLTDYLKKISAGKINEMSKGGVGDDLSFLAL